MKCLWHLNGAVVANNAIMPYLVTTLSNHRARRGFQMNTDVWLQPLQQGLAATRAILPLIAAAGVYRGILLWQSAASGSAPRAGAGGDPFWRGLWHIVFGSIAVAMGGWIQ